MSGRIDASEPGAGVRLDVWLWAARVFKTRALAKHAIETGKVEVNGMEAGKPAKPVHIGDSLRVQRAQERFEMNVLGLSEKRGPAASASALYAETEASRIARQAENDRRRAERSSYQPPGSKPDKRARRLIRALGDIDAL